MTNEIDRNLSCKSKRMDDRDSKDRRSRSPYSVLAGYDWIVVVDEFGNTGPPHHGEHFFGFGVSVLDDPESFGLIARGLQLIHQTDEHKACNASIEDRIAVSKEISRLNVRSFACYIDKTQDVPEILHLKKTYARIGGVLGATLDLVLPPYGDILVIIDYHNQYKGRETVNKICSRRSNDGRIVSGHLFNSSGSPPYSDLLQTNDYVTNAARTKLEDAIPLRSTIIGTSFRQISKHTTFMLDDLR